MVAQRIQNLRKFGCSVSNVYLDLRREKRLFLINMFGEKI